MTQTDPVARPPGLAGPRIGIWGLLDTASFGRLAAAEVLARELAARLPNAAITRFAPELSGDRNPFDTGHPVRALEPWDAPRRAEVAAALDCVVVAGEVLVGDAGRSLLEGPGGGRPVVWSGVGVPEELPASPEVREAVGSLAAVAVRDERSADLVRRAGRRGPVDVVPDPVVLLGRVWDERVLGRRLRYLRAVGAYPEEPPLVVQAGSADLEDVEPLAASLRELAEGGLPVVVIEAAPREDERFASALVAALGPRARRATPLGLQDVAATIAHAAGFIGSSPAGAAAAMAFGTPSLLLGWGDPQGRRAAAEALGDAGMLVERPEDVAGAFREAGGRGDRAASLRALEERLDRHLDDVARLAAAAAPEVPQAPDPETSALLRALRVRGRMLAAQRWQMAERVEDPQERIAELERQLTELRNTKTFRYTAALRGWYERRRRGRGSP